MDTTFAHPDEEIAHLRAHIEKKKGEAKGFEHRFNKEDITRSIVHSYANTPIEQVVPKERRVTASEEHRLLAWLSPRSTDEQVRMLSQVMADKGIRNAIEMAKKTKDANLEDDFHRFLVQYLLSEHEIKNDVSKEEWKALHMVLYEISLPSAKEENGKGMKEFVSLMEQWYASMQSLSPDPANKEKNYYSLEIALANGSDDIMFYCAIHRDYASIFEKTIIGVFPEIKITECKEDYSIFGNNASVACAYALHSTHSALPIKTYKEMEGDPITVLLSSFTKLKKEGEGLSFQVLIRPTGQSLVKIYTKMLDDLRKGETLKRVIDKQDLLKETFKITGDMLSSMFGGGKTEEALKKTDEKKQGHVDDIAMKYLQSKLEHTLVDTNIRIVASAESQSRADMIIRDMEASFRQFTETNGNSLIFKEISGKSQRDFVYDFTYRLFSESQTLPLNLEEVATLYHFPLYVKDVNQVKTVGATTALAPLDLSQEGVVLGVNKFRSSESTIHFSREDRMRHMYVIGQTGTGKTTILKNMIVQDIAQGDGCCFIDPHGSDIDDILANIPAHRREDVIYFDPSSTARPMGLNMLEFDRQFPEQKTFVVNEMLNIFNKLFDMKVSGGPGFEQYFRNATLLVMEHPESGNTLLEIARVFSDKDFRDYKLSKSKNPLLLQFWQNAGSTTGEQSLQNWTQYVTSKFDVFLSNDIMRPIIAQEKSAFNFREIMDSKKIFLVNLSKGRLGDINSYLLGLIIVGKFLQAALSRVATNERPDFYLYIDEFQNVTTPAIATILSEARKYRLSLTIAHQYIAQLTEEVKGAVFGNIGTVCAFRVGTDDAQYLESQFSPVFTVADLMKVENRRAYIRMLSKGEPKKPFSIETLPPPLGDASQIDKLKELSAMTYGRPKEEVDAEIMRKYML